VLARALAEEPEATELQIDDGTAADNGASA